MEYEVGVTDVKISNTNMVKSLYIAQKTRGEEILSTPFEHTLWRKIAELDSRVSGTYFKANLIDPIIGFVEIPPFENYYTTYKLLVIPRVFALVLFLVG
jgi:hypothetical protein